MLKHVENMEDVCLYVCVIVLCLACFSVHVYRLGLVLKFISLLLCSLTCCCKVHNCACAMQCLYTSMSKK